MSIEEKRAKVASYCHVGECSGCVLNGVGWEHKLDNDIEDEDNFTISCIDIFKANESELDKAIELIEGKSSEAKSDPIKPEYYNDTKITPFDVIDDWELNFYLGNAIKYIKRAGKKADNSKLQDLKKVREYIDHEIKVEEAR